MDAPPPLAHREPRSQRQHVRVTLPLTVEIDGRGYHALDWSLGGFRLAGADAGWREGKQAAARLVFPFHGFEVAVGVGCALAFADAAQGVSGWRFTDVDAPGQAVLRHLFHAAVAGRVVEADSLLAAARDHRPPEPSPGHRRGWGARLRRTAGYGVLLVLGLVLAGAVGVSAYGRFFTVEARHAAVSAPIVTLRAHADGRLEGRALAAGAAVEPGAALFAVANDRLASRIRITRAEIARSEAALAALERERTSLAGFFDTYADLAVADMRKAEAERDAARVVLDAAEREVARAEWLNAEGHLADQRLDELRARHAAAIGAARQAEAALAQARANRRLASGGFYFTGSRIEGGRPDELATRVTLAEQDLAVLRTTLAALEDERRGLTQRSPCRCIVDAVEVAPPEWVEAGEAVYRLRRTEPELLLVEAKVAHEEAKRLRPGDAVVLRFADEDGTRAGRVDSIRHGPSRKRRAGLPDGLAEAPDLATVLVRSDRPGLAAAVGLPVAARFPLRPRLVLARWLGGDQSSERK